MGIIAAWSKNQIQQRICANPQYKQKYPIMDTNQIKNLIAQGKLKQALDAMPNTNEIILLMGRLNQLEQAERMSIIAHQDALIERARITDATLQILGNDDTPNQGKTPPNTKQNNTQNIISQATTLSTQQEFAQAFALLDTLNLQQPLYYQLKKEYTSGVYRNDFNYADRLITFLRTL